MIAALLVLGYALALAWILPLPLGRLSEPGVSPRLGLAAWLAAIASVLATVLAALGLLSRAAVAGWPAFARTVCESVTGGTCSPQVYRSAAYELGLAGLAFLGGITMIVLGWRYGRSLRRASVRTRAHAEAARITGRPAGAGLAAENRTAPAASTVVLDATQPAVYCVPGRPPAIVLTTGALALLAPEQLTAVLAHERAHLAGRHHLLLAATRCLAGVAPVVPLFARGTREVARLAEMRADDVAVRRAGGAHGRRTLLAALLAMSAGQAPVTQAPVTQAGATRVGAIQARVAQVPAAWLAVTGGVVAARVRRLADPPGRARGAGHGLALAALTLGTVAVSVLVAWSALGAG